jgi:MerR family transcriptional regulator, heat shock protein HspR
MTPEHSARGVYVISVAAELAGMHPQTLRIYERRGLVGPARTGGGSRRYSDDDISVLRHIQELTTEGLNLEGVRQVIALEHEIGRLRAELERVRGELERTRAQAREEVEQIHRQYRRDLVPVRTKNLPARWRP